MTTLLSTYNEKLDVVTTSPLNQTKEPSTYFNADHLLHDENHWNFQFVAQCIIVPILCSCGILGNILTFIVLMKRMNESIEVIEKGSLVGILALAVSDFLFCAVTLFSTYYSDDSMIFTESNPTLFFTLYGDYFQNLFIKTSTWITVVMAIYRHYVAVQPISAKIHLTGRRALCAILTGCVFWILIHLPHLWTWRVTKVQCTPTDKFLVLGVGAFEQNKTCRQAFLYIWAILGFFIPVCILVYCNMNLIFAMRTSRSRVSGSIRQDRRNQRQAASRRINVTLISIVACFFLFNLPSELLQFYLEIAPSNQNNTGTVMTVAVTVCNVFQALNMSLNFALYCVVNSHFRKSVQSMLASRCVPNDDTQQLHFRNTSLSTRYDELQLRALVFGEKSSFWIRFAHVSVSLLCRHLSTECGFLQMGKN